MSVSLDAPSDWMLKTGNDKEADGIFAGAGGWYITHPDGQVELLQAITGASEVVPNPPDIGRVSNPDSGDYSIASGDVITFTVNWTEPVIVTGTPQILFNENGVQQSADYVPSLSTGTSSVFQFTVTTAGAIDTVVESVQLNLGTITDGDLNNAVLAFVDYTQPVGVSVVA